MIFHEKIKRCLYLFDTYNNKLKTFNFSISFISGLSDSDWNIWINLLDKIINENNKKCKYDNCKYKIKKDHMIYN